MNGVWWWPRSRRRQPHVCDAPVSGCLEVPIGKYGDTWRCPDRDCRQLWRIGLACNLCDMWGRPRPHAGMHDVGAVWRSATLGQRLKDVLLRPVGDP